MALEWNRMEYTPAVNIMMGVPQRGRAQRTQCYWTIAFLVTLASLLIYELYITGQYYWHLQISDFQALLLEQI